jgi:hypothetical protein
MIGQEHNGHDHQRPSRPTLAENIMEDGASHLIAEEAGSPSRHQGEEAGSARHILATTIGHAMNVALLSPTGNAVPAQGWCSQSTLLAFRSILRPSPHGAETLPRSSPVGSARGRGPPARSGPRRRGSRRGAPGIRRGWSKCSRHECQAGSPRVPPRRSPSDGEAFSRVLPSPSSRCSSQE